MFLLWKTGHLFSKWLINSGLRITNPKLSLTPYLDHDNSHHLQFLLLFADFYGLNDATAASYELVVRETCDFHSKTLVGQSSRLMRLEHWWKDWMVRESSGLAMGIIFYFLFSREGSSTMKSFRAHKYFAFFNLHQRCISLHAHTRETKKEKSKR